MLELLENYSLQEIVVFIVMLAVAGKAFFTFWDWVVERLKKIFLKDIKQQSVAENIEHEININRAAINEVIEIQKQTNENINELSQRVENLIESDKDDIKAWITREHHYFCYQKGYIDDFSLDCIEKRYHHYVKEGGNSFVANLMNDIRELPNEDLNQHNK